MLFKLLTHYQNKSLNMIRKINIQAFEQYQDDETVINASTNINKQNQVLLEQKTLNVKVPLQSIYAIKLNFLKGNKFQ